MSDMRDYYLKNLGIGEIWQLRQSNLPVSPALTELVAGEVEADTDTMPSVEKALVMPVAAPAAQSSTISLSQSDESSESPVDWQVLHKTLQQCQACSLCAKFGKGMLGSGDTSATVMVITDWSAADGSVQLDPILQQSEKLLSNILAALSLGDKTKPSSRTLAVYRTSLLKAKISDSSQITLDVASADAVSSCQTFLHQEIHQVTPKVLLVFGESLARRLLGVDVDSKMNMRQAQHQYQEIPVIVTHDPHFLLKHPQAKYEVWQDLCRLRQL
jgi:uracil-DNA glycosylase family 4